MINTKRFIFLVVPILVLSFAEQALPSDWPMWRCDSGRSASSADELPSELHLKWIHRYSRRSMAWDDPLNQDLMPYDRIFEPVVAGKTMFIGFNDSDKVVAIDCMSGKEKWTYFADGPVRFPPVAWNDRVYFTSDDGYVYCVFARNGKLVWKFRGGPNNRKILGNKRLISTWPARGAPVIEDGILYFAASIWPFMGTFIYALDAKTGDVIWLNDSNGLQWMVQPHRAPSFAGAAPQGALVVSGDKLLIPSGRSVPACFDKRTGKFLYYHLNASGKTGGTFVCSNRSVFFNHHRDRITSMYHLGTGNKLVAGIGMYPVIDGDMCYFSGERIIACDIGWAADCLERWIEEAPEKKLSLSELQNLASKEVQDNILWNIDIDASGDLIKAGNRLYAAGGQTITAIDIPTGNSTPSIAWTKMTDGTIERLVAANDMLFAVTIDGQILAFGEKKSTPRIIHEQTLPVESSPGLTKQALSMLDDVGITEGYALFYGIGDGNLLEALTTNSNLHIIAADPDEAVVKKMKHRFDKAGLYGRRITVLTGDPFTLNAPPYMASLTVVHELDSGKYPLDRGLLDRLYHSMRPYGGKTILQHNMKDRLAFSDLSKKAELNGLSNTVSNEYSIITRNGPIEGSAEWTHLYGSMANTAKSDDKLVKLPLGILWFGGSSNTDVLPRHGHGPTEQVIGGRLFIEGIDSMSCRDVYTGRVIWKVPLLDMGTYGIYYDETYKDVHTDLRYNQVHIPGANIRGTNYIATKDRVYVLQGGRCHVLDAETGKTVKIITLPPIDPEARRPAPPTWGYIGVYEDLLIGGYGFVAYSDLLNKKKAEYSAMEDYDSSASKKLLIMDRFSGEITWEIESNFGFLHNGIAAGSGRLYCLDKLPLNTEMQLGRRGKPVPGGSVLRAVDIRTGESLWENREHVFGSYLSYSKEHDILLQSARPSRDMVRDEPGERMAAFRGSDGTLLWDKAISYRTFPILHGETIITEGKFFNLFTGELVERDNPLTGEKTAWTWSRQYGCNYPIASENLLTFRSGAAGFYDLVNGGGTGNLGGFKSGCTINLVAADGVLNAPDYTRTCQCAYQNQTSLALIHMPENEFWTYNDMKTDDAPLQRFGLNFGAPGDRVADNGTLWLDYPSVGGQSPEVSVTTSPESPEWYLHHSSSYDEAGQAWIAASGGVGLRELKISVAQNRVEKSPYTVRLFFAEPEDIKSGDRVFDVSIQGKTVLDNFDIAGEAGKPRHTIVKEFYAIAVGRDLVITFNPVGTSGTMEPLLCGIEVIEE
ncbi:PQQ-binding-like beta-propeller repeat protein [Candidatus Omnitrophota bacterium]